ASSDTGLWGGGAIQFTVSGTTTINGSLSANGSSSEPIDQCWNPGGGSGGSILIVTGGLTGNGQVSAKGGAGVSGNSGGGGGGRISILANSNNSSLTKIVSGGQTGNSRKGAEGTVNSNGGAVLVPGSLSLATSTASSVTVAISGAGDSIFGLAASPYTFYNVTAGTDSGATSSAAWLSQSLSPNTGYDFYAKVFNNLGVSVKTSTTTLLTLANIPTNLLATLTSPGQITLSWNANANPPGTEYLAFDVNDNSDSGWSTSTTAVFSGLSCGTPYSFQVKARNLDNTETIFTDPVSASTQSCNHEPNVPTALGPTVLVSGGWAAGGNYGFSFTLSDPDSSDLLQYRIQISGNSDFSNPLVDFTSDAQAQGPAVLTLNQTLPDSVNGYYWRVKAIDSHGQASDYAVANNGAAAFKVDTTSPLPGVLGVVAAAPGSLLATISGAADAVSGLAQSPYVFTNQITGETSGVTASSTWLSPGLAANTQYDFIAQISDAAGNVSKTEVARAYTLANLPTGLVAAASGNQITLTWGANGNPANTEYLVLNTFDGTSSGWSTSTAAVFTGLACNTNYSFKVAARNGDKVETLYTDTVSQSVAVCSNPFSPSNLGPDSVMDGGWISTGKPQFTFTLSDPDLTKSVKYRIQIAVSPDFSSPLVDYTSGLLSQGPANFTVGQSAGSGAYGAGMARQSLQDSASGYYWRVMAINNFGSSSSYVSANSGKVAFKVDTISPVSGSLSSSNVSQHTVKVTVTGSGDALSGLADHPYVLRELTTNTTFDPSSKTSWEINKLNSGTVYQFQVTVTDIAGNNSNSAILSVQTKGNPKDNSNEDASGIIADQSGPAPLSVQINGGVTSTVSSLVTLSILGNKDSAQMTVSNLPFNIGTIVQPISSTVENWDLCARTACVSGPHTVYVSFYTSASELIAATSTTILLEPAGKVKGAEIQAAFKSNLGRGSSGDEVLVLQNVLANLGFLKSQNVTGYFGSMTTVALGKFQISNKLSSTGKVDSKTREFLNGLLVK
ncbi:MAG: peptidoglycan-binding protein, partial [Patescibacteria group bacterium]|nr:peptidoglycan-binding protein [Patescibacteria group bacterium]